jgi:endonuclease/exonuclease/phosphatase family metal-dependent hydrolase
MFSRFFLRSLLWRHLGAVLLALASVGAAPAAEAPATNSIKILTCNVRIDFPEDKKNGDNWEARQAFCRDVISRQGADIICLQEARAAHIAVLDDALKRHERYGMPDAERPHGPRMPGLSIYYDRERFTPAGSGGFWLSETPTVAGSKSWDSLGAVYINWIQLRDKRTKREFRIWNTHFDARSGLARQNEAVMVAQATRELAADYPQILAGDFNAHAASGPITLLHDAGWKDTYTEVHGPADPGLTFHGFRGADYRPNSTAAEGRGKIDFVFTRGPIRATAAEIIRDSQNGHYPSDHYFISATVELVP